MSVSVVSVSMSVSVSVPWNSSFTAHKTLEVIYVRTTFYSLITRVFPPKKHLLKKIVGASFM